MLHSEKIGSSCICAECKLLFEALGLEGEFNASCGWLTNFKQQCSIHKIAVQGECHGAMLQQVIPFVENVRNSC
jgi:hypothetical protein